MEEVTSLTRGFDERITLSADNLYLHFGKENGAAILSSCFQDVTWIDYEDSLFVTEAAPLISYILFCHGNQNQYLASRYRDFASYIEKQVADGFSITKDAGLFRAIKMDSDC